MDLWDLWQAGAEVTLPGELEKIWQGIGFIMAKACKMLHMQYRRQTEPAALVLIITEYLVLEIWNKL